MSTRTVVTALAAAIVLVGALLPAPAASARLEVGRAEPLDGDELTSPRPYPPADALGRPFVWKREIVRPGATFLKIHFAEFDLGPGDVLTIVGDDGRHVREYRERGPRGDGEFWAFAVPGERAVVTLTSFGGGAGVRADRVGVGSVPKMPAAVCGTDGREDVACYGTGDQAKELLGPVTRILFEDGGFFFVCTGFLVRGSNNSLMMTNQHCVDDQSGVNTVEAWFNYQNTNCGGTADDPIDTYFGNTFLATDVGLDYTLMTLSGNPESVYGEFVATRDAPAVNDRMALPQHSGGDEKTLAVFEGENRSGGQCTIKGVRETLSGWTANSQINYTCDMEGGASGSPVIGRDQGHEVIGINHVETIGCLFNDGNYATHMDDICDDAGSLLNCSN